MDRSTAWVVTTILLILSPLLWGLVWILFFAFGIDQRIVRALRRRRERRGEQNRLYKPLASVVQQLVTIGGWWKDEARMQDDGVRLLTERIEASPPSEVRW